MLTDYASATSYYVAVDGSDTNAGTQTSPFRHIQTAAGRAVAGDTIIVYAGTYRETITPANSGTAAAPITYLPHAGADVTISGADLVTGWMPADRNVFVADGVAGFSSTNNQAIQVFADGQMLNEARWPNASLDVSHPAKATIASVIGNVMVNGKHRAVVTDPTLTQPSGYWTGASISFGTDKNYMLSTGTVIESLPGTLTFEYGATSGTAVSAANPMPVAGNQYFLFGKRAALDAPGEWYYDATDRKLFVWLPDSDDPSDHVIEIKRRDWGFDLSRKSHITIQGLRLFAATVTTDTAAGDGNPGRSFAGRVRQNSTAPSNHIVLDRLDVKYPSHFTDLSGFAYNQWTNNTGIVLSGSDQILRNSRISYSAGNGVSVLGERNKVLANIINDVDYAGMEGAGISTGFQNTRSVDHEIGYNEVSTSGRGLIEIRSLTGGAAMSARVHHNLLRESGLQTWDNGAIYTWQNNGNGLEIDHNWIYDNHGIRTSAGIYLDDSSFGYSIHHNVIADTDYGIILNNQASQTPAGYRNSVRDNVVIATCRAISNYGTANPDTLIKDNVLAGGINLSPDSGATLADNRMLEKAPGSPTFGACRHRAMGLIGAIRKTVDAGRRAWTRIQSVLPARTGSSMSSYDRITDRNRSPTILLWPVVNATQ